MIPEKTVFYAGFSNTKLPEKACKISKCPKAKRLEIFRHEEMPLLAPLPAAPYELAEWK